MSEKQRKVGLHFKRKYKSNRSLEEKSKKNEFIKLHLIIKWIYKIITEKVVIIKLRELDRYHPLQN